MVRGKGVGKLPFVILAVAIIAIALMFTAFSDMFLTTLGETFNYYSEQKLFGMTLVPDVNILCIIQSETDIIDINNNRFRLTQKAPTIIDTFINFQVTGLTSTSSEIKHLDPKAEIKCDPQFEDVDSINLVGGWVNTKHEVQDQNGNFKTISSVTKSIPDFPRTIKGRLVQIPTDTVTAQEIENTANLMGVLSKNVQVKTTISTNVEILNSATGGKLNTGEQVITSAGYVKIIVDQPPPTTSQGRLVDITSINPTGGYCFLGTTTIGCGSTSQQQIDFTGGTMEMDVKGVLDNWTTSEGLPFLRIFDPRGQKVGSDVVMTSTPRDLGNGQHEFKRVNFDIARTITENNIQSNKGTWIIEMHSNGDVRKSLTGQTVIDRKTFILQDLSPLVPDEEEQQPNCSGGQIIEDGMCKDPKNTEPPSTEQCPTTAELDTYSKSLTVEQLALGVIAFEDLTPLNACQQKQLDSLNKEGERRGLDLTIPETPEGITGTTAQIRYVANYEPTGAESNEGCQDIKIVPPKGVEIQTFQLVGLGGTKCDGFRFGNIELRPVLNFGDNLKNIQIDKSSFDIPHKLFMSVNNPFPTNPTFDCNIQSANIPSTCVVSNHVFEDDPSVSFTNDEVTPLFEPTDRETSGEYQLSFVEIDAGSLENKLRNAGIVLKDGDTYSYMLFIAGTFDLTVNGQPVKGVLPPLTFSQQFSYQEYGGIICDNETEFFDSTAKECKPLQLDTCTPPSVRNPQTQLCEIINDDGSRTTCPEIPECKGNENIVVLDEKDACDNNLLECQPIEGEPIPRTPDGELPILIPPTNDKCPSMYSLNALGNCQLIGSGTTCEGDGCEPKGTTSGSGLCDLDSDFNFGQCFASLFAPEGEGKGFQISGITQTAIIIVVLVMILVIVIAVIVRKYRGGINPF